MELDALHRPLSMAHPHDFALFIAGGDHELRRETGLLDDEGVIAHGFERGRKPLENALAIVRDLRGLSVHEAFGPHDVGAESRPDALMPQTHPQDGDAAGKILDGGHGYARFFGRARPGRDHQVGGLQIFQLFHRDLVVAEYGNLRSRGQLLTHNAQQLHQVVGEGIVVVDDNEMNGHLKPPVRHFDGLNHTASLVDGLLELAFWIGVSNDPGAGLEIEARALLKESPDGDAEIHVAGETEISHGSGVRSAAGVLQLLDDLHGADLRGTGDRARGEGGLEHVEHVLSRSQIAPHAGNEMHHVGIALDDHELVHLHTAVGGHASDVVSPEINEHEVFGALLGIVEEIFGEGLIFGFRAPARPGAGDGTHLDGAFLEPDENLGRGTDEGLVPQAEIEEIGRRVYLAQGAVDVERTKMVFSGKTL